jgi:arsenate reductase
MIIYGIKQCDTCRKALKWLEENNIFHQFHDFRVDGLDKVLLSLMLDSEFADVLLNRRSTTWRNLSADQKASEGEALIQLLLDNPTLIKRPVFVDGKVLAVGFAPESLAKILKVSD